MTAEQQSTISPAAERIRLIEQATEDIGRVDTELRKTVLLPLEYSEMISLAAVEPTRHFLLQGNPGTGKTLTAKTLARVMGLSFGRVQGSEDTTPSDITGNMIWNVAKGDYEFMPGPLFNNVVLIDEHGLLRSQARAGLIEGMEEGQVTVRRETHPLPQPHLVVATQNKIEDPRSKVTAPNRDRFAFRLQFPDLSVEDMIAITALRGTSEAVFDPQRGQNIREQTERIHVSPATMRYIGNIIEHFRDNKYVDKQSSVLGGDRPFKDIVLFAKKRALSQKRPEARGEDVVTVARPILHNRIELDFTVGYDPDGVKFLELYDTMFKKVLHEARKPAS